MERKTGTLRGLFMLFPAILFAALFTSCGGGGGSSYESGGSTGGGGTGSDAWITISSPTTDPSTSTDCNSITLGGEAFISPTWMVCCSGSAQTLTGVTVTWENMATGETGTANQNVDICFEPLLTPRYPCHHTWDATIPLALGNNEITVTASDPSNRTSRDSISVAKPVWTYSVSGKVMNMAGDGLWNYGLSGFKLTLTGNDSNPYTFTGESGEYSFSCVENGSYTITPFSTINFAFEPASRTAIVTNADVVGHDFVTEAYFVFGTVTYQSGAGFSGVQMSLTGSGSSATYYTDANGYYAFAVPNGSYTITPTLITLPGLPGPSFQPSSRNVEVAGMDVPGQDFVAQ